MTKEVKIVIAIAIGFGLFVAFSSIKTEYARIQSRVETTQAKVDALADELQATTKTIHAAIRSLTDRFLAGDFPLSDEAIHALRELESVESLTTVEQVKKEVDNFKPSTVPTIVMHSGYDCGPCNAWLSSEMPKWLQSGWRVEVVKESDSARSWPWYEITDRDGSRSEVNGPLTNSNFNAAKAGVK